MEGTTMNRREAIRSLSFASGASLLMSTPSLAGVLASKSDALCAQALRGTAPVKIRDIKTILTAPNHIRLVVVKDRKSTRLNSSHLVISYAVFCLKKKKK